MDLRVSDGQRHPLLQDADLPRAQARLAHAKGYAVSYAQTYLPAYPAAWIYRMIDSDFAQQYAMYQRDYTTIKVMFATLLIVVMPSVYAHTAMPYPCTPESFEHLGKSRDRLLLQKTTCDLEDWLRSPASLAIGLVCAICGFCSLPLSQRFWGHRNHFLASIRSQFPTLPYGGFGSVRSPHSAAKLMGARYSWVHHFFGAPDLMVLTIAMAANLFAAFVVLGLLLGDVATSGVFGFAVVKLFIAGVNALLGTQPFVVNMVRAKLDVWQPLSNKDADAKLNNACEERAASCERQGNISLAAEIREKGPGLLRDLRSCVAKVNTRGLILRLLDNATVQHVYLTEEEIAAICTIDPHSFLVAYFDPDFETHPWDAKFTLRSIFNPVSNDALVLKDGKWRLSHA